MDVSNRSEHQLRVDEFMRLAQQQLPCRPMIPDRDVRKLRANLILEEAIEGLGFHVALDPCYSSIDPSSMEGVSLIDYGEPDLVKIADGCADTRVVTTGTLSACGIDDEPVQREVDEANLRKFGPGARRRESDGKWMKPPGFTPPDIEGQLKRQGWIA